MHIIWRGRSCFQIIVSQNKGEQLKINIDDSKILVGDFVIDGPGEYEIKDVYIQGISVWHNSSSNTIYVIEAEDMRLCYLGSFEQKELDSSQLDKIGDVDILMVPADKTRLVNQLEPRIVIPSGEGINKFLKEMGKKAITPQPKLLIKKKDLPTEEMQIIILKP